MAFGTPIAHVSRPAGGSGGGTSTAIDTTGANFLVIVVGDENAFAPVSDSKGNLWVRWVSSIVSATQQANIWYAKNPIVGTAHTFTVGSSSTFPTFCVAAFAGSFTEFPAGATTTNNNATAASIQAGSLTPTVPNGLVIAGLGYRATGAAAITAGFTIVDQCPFNSGVAVGSALAYQIQTVPVAANPTWSWTGSVGAAAVCAYFTPLVSAPGAVTTYWPIDPPVVNRVFTQASAATLTTAAFTSTPGNLLVAIFQVWTGSFGATPITDNKGNTWVPAVPIFGGSGGSGLLGIYYAANCLGGAGHTVTVTPVASGLLALAVYEIAGAALTGVLGSNSTQNASTAAHDSGAIAANPAVSEFFLGAMTISHSAAANALSIPYPAPANWSGLMVSLNGGNVGLASAWRIVNPSTTDSFKLTAVGGATAEAIAVVGFKAANPAPAGGGAGSVGGSYGFA